MLAEKFKVLNTLGSGATAEVKLVQDIATEQQFACKVFKNGPKGEITEKLLETVKKESTIACGIKHEYIVNVLAVGRGVYDKEDGSTPEEVMYLLMDYA